MKNSLNERKYIEILNKVIKDGLRSCCEDFNYQEVADAMLCISGAMVVAFNLYNEDKTKTKTVAVAGDSKIIKKAGKLTGFDIVNKDWDIIPERIEAIKKQKLIQSTSIHEVSFGAIGKRAGETIEKVFGIGDIYFLKISYNELIGDFLLFFKKGEVFENKTFVKDYIGHIESILMRYRMEKKMKDSEERYKELAMQSRTFIWEVDKNAKYVYVSDNIKEIFGYKPEEVIGKKTVFDLHPKEGLEEFKKDVLKTIKKKEKIKALENPIVSKNGDVFWVLSAGMPVLDKKGRLISYRGSDTDISEIKKAEQDLRKNKEKYEMIVKNIPGITYRCLFDKKWTMVFVSDDIKGFTGYRAEDFVNNKKLSYASVIYKEDVKYVEQEIKSAISKKTFWEINYRIKDKEKNIKWVSEKGRAVFNKKGAVIFLDGIIIDINDKKVAEQKLEENEEIFRSIIESTLSGYWDWNLVDNTEYLSPAFKKMFGYKDHEMESSPESWQKIIFPEDLPGVLEVFNRHIKSHGREPFYNEIRYRHKNGSTIWVICTGLVIEWAKDGSPIRMAGCHIDITDRKRAESELQKKEEQFELAVHGSNDGIWDWNLETNELYLSPKWKEQIGYKKNELKDNFETFEKLLYPEDKERVLDYVNKYLKGEVKNYNIEFRMIHKKGGIRWVLAKGAAIHDEKGKPYRMAGSHSDITLRKQFERELLEEKRELEKFKLAVENASDHIVITDENGICMYMNKAAERITGFKKKEILGKKVGSKDNWGGLMKKNDYEELWRVIKKEKKVFYGELKNKRKNGERYDALASISPIVDENKKVIFFIGIEHDITKEKEIDRVKTEFVSLASHQLRTPLSSINWYAEMLLDGDAGNINEEQEAYLQEIYKGNQRMVELVNALLNVSRLELGSFSIEPVKTDIKILLKNVLNELKPLIEEKKQVVKESYEKNISLIKHDPNLLNIVFQNILSNAVKYTPEGGTIDVSIFSAKEGEVIKRKKIKEKALIIAIKDSGYGIPQGQKDKIFTKLFRADNIMEKDTEGTGLGLYIVKSIIEQSGGDVWFQSKEDKGTTFYLLLPVKGVIKKSATKKLT